jgi:hypothetical protein
MYICIIPHNNERSRESLRNVGIVLRIDVSDQPETLQRIKKQVRLCTRSNGANISDWLTNSRIQSTPWEATRYWGEEKTRLLLRRQTIS